MARSMFSRGIDSERALVTARRSRELKAGSGAPSLAATAFSRLERQAEGKIMVDTSVYDRMRAGEPYAGPHWYLLELQMQARQKLDTLNALSNADLVSRTRLLKSMLGSFGESFVMSPVTW